LSEKKSSWKGLSHYAKVLVYGSAASSPKIGKGDFGTSNTPTDSDNYASMDKDYRWFRQDELVRRCTIINACFTALAAGFETVLEPTKPIADGNQKKAFLEKYQYVKDYVDAINKAVNFDQVLFVAQIKRSIFGKCGFEIVFKTDGKTPAYLISLQSPKLTPKKNKDWELIGFKYTGIKEGYDVNEVLYFVNTQLENDFLGLSDVEPIRSTCKARNYLLDKDFPEITRRLWAPYTLLEADTADMADDDETAFLKDLAKIAEAGKSTAINKSVTAQVVEFRINLGGLVQLMDKLEEGVIRAYGTPRFLINKTPENRATAYVEFEAYVEGVIKPNQRYFKRALECDMWYDRLARLAMEEKGEKIAAGVALPVKVKQNFKPVKASDIYAMAAAVASLYGNGSGVLAEFPEIAFEMMNWDQELLKAKEKSPQPGKTSVVKGEDKEGKYEEYIIRRRLPPAHKHS